MNWPGFALITYAFILLLVLILLVLRGRRDNKGRYQRILEEKEQKLAAAQLELEDTLQVITEQATAVQAQWEAAQRQDQDTIAAMQERILSLQSTVVELQSRLLRLEHPMRPAQYPAAPKQTAAEPAQAPAAEAAEPPPQTAKEQEKPEEPKEREGEPVKRKRQSAGRAGRKKPAGRDAGGAQKKEAPDTAEQKRRAIALLEAGWTADQLAKELQCSRVEAVMLENQWRRGYETAEPPETQNA